MEVLFTWIDEESTENNVSLLISRANTVHTDPFANQSTFKSLVDEYQLEREGNVYTCKVFLNFGVYHFLFKISTVNEGWMEVGEKHNSTVLGSGRRVNYVDVGAISPKSTSSFSDCIADYNENSPLLHAEKSNEVEVVDRKNASLCCCCCVGNGRD